MRRRRERQERQDSPEPTERLTRHDRRAGRGLCSAANTVPSPAEQRLAGPSRSPGKGGQERREKAGERQRLQVQQQRRSPKGSARGWAAKGKAAAAAAARSRFRRRRGEPLFLPKDWRFWIVDMRFCGWALFGGKRPRLGSPGAL